MATCDRPEQQVPNSRHLVSGRLYKLCMLYFDSFNTVASYH